MNSRLEEIARRKQALVQRCREERTDLSLVCQRLSSPFHVSSKIVGLGQTLKTHPIIAAGISSLLVSGYAGKILRSTRELFKVLRMVLPIWTWWRKRRKRP